MAMSSEEGFGWGFAAATFLWLVIIVLTARYRTMQEYEGYEDKMVIEYHCPGKDYERQLFLDMVNGSGIQTNFTNKSFSMDKHTIKLRMTNPTK